MNLLYGIAGETYKAVRKYITEQEVKILTNSKKINLFALKNQSAAFQVLLFSDIDYLLSVTETTAFDKRGIVNNVRLAVTFTDNTLNFKATNFKSSGLPASDLPTSNSTASNSTVSNTTASNSNVLNSTASNSTASNSTATNFKSSIFPVGFVEDDDRILKADILLTNDYISIECCMIQPVWIELMPPSDICPGVYSGSVDIFIHKGFGKEHKAGKVEFELCISEISLPDPSQYRFHLDLWQHNSNIARKHEVKLWSEEHFEVMENYIKSLAELGQKAATVVASEIPWSGQGCYREIQYPSDLYEYSMIGVSKETGKLKLDFSVVDRYIELCMKYGVDREIEVFGLINIWVSEEEGFGGVVPGFSDGIRIRYLDYEDNCYKYIDNPEDIIFYIQQVETYFIDRGWIEKVRITADEPSDVELYKKRLLFLKEIAPSFKYKAALNHADFIRQFSVEINDFVPGFLTACEEFERLNELKGIINGRLCWYVCCGPDIPNTFIKSHLLESWAIGLLTAYMGLDGFLRWNYTVWPERPRERLSWRWSAGDMNFVYPSCNGKPLLSLRYKALQRGIQFFELIKLVKDKNPDFELIISHVFKKLFKFSSIDEFNYSKHKNIGEFISLEYGDYTNAMKYLADSICNEVCI